ncbi:MAG: hypothetical protein ABSA46_07690 [Thermodesulfovibrionales bacterium]
MKKVIVLVVSVLFVLSVVGFCFAADEMNAAPAATTAPAKKAPAKVHHITGEVVAVDAAAKTLTVKAKKEDVALSADDKAAAKLADVKVGDKVMVTYKEVEGKKVATHIAEKKGKMEKKESMPAEKTPAPAPAK